LRHQHRTLDAELLAMGLKSYSERGMAYVKVIQTMIRSNRKLIQSA
jgi:Bax protein